MFVRNQACWWSMWYKQFFGFFYQLQYAYDDLTFLRSAVLGRWLQQHNNHIIVLLRWNYLARKNNKNKFFGPVFFFFLIRTRMGGSQEMLFAWKLNYFERAAASSTSANKTKTTDNLRTHNTCIRTVLVGSFHLFTSQNVNRSNRTTTKIILLESVDNVDNEWRWWNNSN